MPPIECPTITTGVVTRAVIAAATSPAIADMPPSITPEWPNPGAFIAMTVRSVKKSN